MTDEGYEEVPPDPAATIEALRALGYSPESALADLIDNSIGAGSTEIDVVLHWSGSDSWCAVVDNGSGMSDSTLTQAMRIGSRDPLAERDEVDLGRFGMGLKTASFSQCRELTVSSRSADGKKPHIRSWDLDHVRAVGRWELRRSAPDGLDGILSRVDVGTKGTCVVWRRLDELVDPESSIEDEVARRRFIDQTSAIERHVAMVFGRFLVPRTDSVTIRVNGQVVRTWDPFLVEDPATQQIPPERLELKRQKVMVRPYVLPHRSKLTEDEFEAAGGPGGWNAQQGFYVYRNDRLIVAGDWLGFSLPRDDSHNLARIAVDVPTTLDREWSLDVTKGTVRPPAGIREDLRRIARSTRARASAVVRHRGAPVGPRRRRSVVPVWQQVRRHGELIFTVNREHPVIRELLEASSGQRREVNAVLDLVESTIPVPALPTQPPAERPDRGGSPPDAVISLARNLYEAYIGRGIPRDEAAQRVMNCEPFDDYPELAELIWRDRR